MRKRHKIYINSLILLMIFLAAAYLFCVRVEAATEYHYLIKVNKQQNCITVYEKDETNHYTVPVKAMICSTGSATPLGTYNTKVKYRWKVLLENVWGQYSTRITGHILFHSVWYYKQDPSTLSATQYNKLGTTCSHGCIRLTVEDAKWIYDNCPLGTTVEIYNDKVPGPLGKPKASKLPAGTGWDPTDPAKENPFHTMTPILTGLSDKSIEYESNFDPYEGVIAISGKGVDLTDQITIDGEVDTSKAGVYKLKYSVKDSDGNKKTKTIKVTVKNSVYEVTLQGITDRVISCDDIVNRSFCLKGVSAYYGDEKFKKTDILVDIKENDLSYEVTYEATYKNGQSARQVVTFYVDILAPLIYVDHVIYEENPSIDHDFVLQYVKVVDDWSELTNEDIKTSIVELYDGAYLVTYTVCDQVGNSTSETVQFTRKDNLMIHGVHNRYITENTSINEDYLMLDVTGTDGTKDVTKDIVVKVSELEDDRYTVNYYLETENEFVEITSYLIIE